MTTRRGKKPQGGGSRPVDLAIYQRQYLGLMSALCHDIPFFNMPPGSEAPVGYRPEDHKIEFDWSTTVVYVVLDDQRMMARIEAYFNTLSDDTFYEFLLQRMPQQSLLAQKVENNIVWYHMTKDADDVLRCWSFRHTPDGWGCLPVNVTMGPGHDGMLAIWRHPLFESTPYGDTLEEFGKDIIPNAMKWMIWLAEHEPNCRLEFHIEDGQHRSHLSRR